MYTSELVNAALLSGGPIRVKGLTYFLQGGKIRVRPSKRGPRKSRQEGEMESSNRFTEVRKMWRVYRRAIGDLAMWQIGAREMGAAKSDSLFHSWNGGCLLPGQGVWAFSAFRFSVGSLEMPVITGVCREGQEVVIEWKNDIDRPKAGATDRVFVGFFYDTLPRSPGLVRVTDACRGDGRAAVKIPGAGQPEGTRLHLYLFFGNEKLDRFSPSEYVTV